MNHAAPSLIVHEEYLERLKFASDGLLPVVVTDTDGVVLMVAYADKEAVRRTLTTGRTWFYSRSRQQYWAKGETSGNVQRVLEVRTDCDLDTLLVTVEQLGDGACHTGSYSCFFEVVATSEQG